MVRKDQQLAWQALTPLTAHCCCTQMGSRPLATVGRIPLSSEASCLSLAHFFELTFGAHHLQLHGRPLHTGFVRYLALGQLVVCLHHEHVKCLSVSLPPAELACHAQLQQEWLLIEVDSLIEVQCPSALTLRRVAEKPALPWRAVMHAHSTRILLSTARTCHL